jgi:hypothetical protein
VLPRAHLRSDFRFSRSGTPHSLPWVNSQSVIHPQADHNARAPGRRLTRLLSRGAARCAHTATQDACRTQVRVGRSRHRRGPSALTVEHSLHGSRGTALRQFWRGLTGRCGGRPWCSYDGEAAMAGLAAGMHDERTSRRRFLQLGGIAGGLAAAGPLLVVAPDAVTATRDRPA